MSELEPGPDEEVVADFAANRCCSHWRCLSTASGNAVTRWLERVYASVGEHFPGADAVGDMRVFTGRVGVREYIVDSGGKKAVDPATGDAAVRVRTMSYDPAELPFPGLRQGCAQPGSHALMAASGRLGRRGPGWTGSGTVRGGTLPGNVGEQRPVGGSGMKNDRCICGNDVCTGTCGDG